MIVIKLIVLSVYVVYISCFINYCEICRDHTLCLFVEAGPNVTCKAYDKTALLTKEEINEIVDKINEKRNYIAMGFNNILPQAANMKKVHWSSELATFAQRWVDQCDPALQPDKEDQCRDMYYIKVGQNIATIQGQSPGLQAKSFVEMWYMQILKYQGIVTYYNQSQHNNTDYFTQLIWAETDSVGCGKARFYVESKHTIVERLICNFAPKGNINGKPVYTIGYPGTQCPNNMTPDVKYAGLCVKVQNNTARKCTTQQPHVSSLLRILNLSNSSVKQDIDPIRNNLKQINNTNYQSNDQRNQKIRHVYFNHTHGEMKRVSPLRAQNFWNPSNNNNNLSYLNRNQQERGHSRLYHGYEAHLHDHDPQNEMNGQNIRRYDITTDSINSYSDGDYRKYGYQNNHCTRRMQPPRNNYGAHECNTPICMSREKCDNCHQLTTACQRNPCVQDPCPTSRCKTTNECPCNKQTTCFTTPTKCTCNVNCKCLNMGTPPCPDFLRMKDEVNLDETRKSQSQLPEYKLYDLPAPVLVRSGNKKLHNKNSSPRSQSMYKSMKKINSRREYDEYHEQVKESKPSLKLHAQDRDYLYETFDSSKRKRRDLEEHITFRPFWEIEKSDYKKPSELKSIRYTTLGTRKHRKSKASTSTPKPNVVTESITISLKNTPSTRYLKSHVSEKYLSFDELMRLRKLTTEETYQNPRRRINDENILREEPSSSTTEITTNTPFIRKKQCTRKLTCTWTAWMLSGGDIFGPGGGGGGGGGFADRGSRTPPGYVEGCTRTSTCTREFMNRNKMSTIPDSATASEASHEDEDYCERRALNVQRRNLEAIPVTNSAVETENKQTESITTSTTINYESTSDTKILFVPQYGCVCGDKNLRLKRNFKDVTRIKRHKNDVPINNMHIITRKNTISSNRRNINHVKCPCNGATSLEYSIYLCTFIYILLIY